MNVHWHSTQTEASTESNANIIVTLTCMLVGITDVLYSDIIEEESRETITIIFTHPFACKGNLLTQIFKSTETEKGKEDGKFHRHCAMSSIYM